MGRRPPRIASRVDAIAINGHRIKNKKKKENRGRRCKLRFQKKIKKKKKNRGRRCKLRFQKKKSKKKKKIEDVIGDAGYVKEIEKKKKK